MSAKPIDMLERQLQDLIEGAFSRLFSRSIHARDIAILLLRAMEDEAYHAGANQTNMIAPDSYTIFLSPDIAARFITRFPDLPARLAKLLADLSRESGHLLLAVPVVSMRADDQLQARQARVAAAHSPAARAKTNRMNAVSPSEATPALARVARLQIQGVDDVPLTKTVINIGRDSANDVVISDAFVSRRHVQLREHSGVYTLFDVNSRGGALVNNAVVSEHRLQNGDVIRIGHTDVVYADDVPYDDRDGATQILPLD